MANHEKIPGWTLLEQELNRTGVISEAFKGTLFAIAGRVAEDARERGREEGRKLAESHARSQTLNAQEVCYLAEVGRLDNRTLDAVIRFAGHYAANLRPGERVEASEGELRRLAMAILIRCRRGGEFG